MNIVHGLGLISICSNVLFRPLWPVIFEIAAVGPSTACVTFQAVTFMIFPLDLRLSSLTAAICLLLLFVGMFLTTYFVAPAADPAFPAISTSPYHEQFGWASAFTVYFATTFCSWLYMRYKRKSLRRLFLLSERKMRLLKRLELNGTLDPKKHIAGLWKGPQAYSAGGAEIYNNGQFKSSSVLRGNDAFDASISWQDYSIRPQTGYSEGIGPHGSMQELKRPYTMDSNANSVSGFPMAKQSRPGSSFYKFVNSSVLLHATEERSSFPRKKSDKTVLNIRTIKLHDVEAQSQLAGLFLGQPPWPTYNERRYLRDQARRNSTNLCFFMICLSATSVITSVLDNFDRTEGAPNNNFFLLQIIPLSIIPLIAFLCLYFFVHSNRLLFVQPVAIVSFWTLIAAYLLSPMEQMSCVYPNAIPQSKMTAYLAAAITVSAQSTLIPARSFAPFCVSVAFLAVAHVPLAMSWGSASNNMIWSTSIQIVVLVIALAPLVRAFDGIERESFIASQTVKCCMELELMPGSVAYESGLIRSRARLDENGRLRSALRSRQTDRKWSGRPNPSTAAINPGSQKLQRLLDQCDLWLSELDESSAGDAGLGVKSESFANEPSKQACLNEITDVSNSKIADDVMVLENRDSKAAILDSFEFIEQYLADTEANIPNESPLENPSEHPLTTFVTPGEFSSLDDMPKADDGVCENNEEEPQKESPDLPTTENVPEESENFLYSSSISLSNGYPVAYHGLVPIKNSMPLGTFSDIQPPRKLPVLRPIGKDLPVRVSDTVKEDE
ncbi:hypothetical protein HDU83_001811 [Entophlyctis luteolus]|nr:hypothetical protein HDU83_001811 [Entophlyctis luteolus]